MGHATPQSPKHGYAFDGYERDVRRARKAYDCVGAVPPRSGGLGRRASNCTFIIRPGDVYVATMADPLFAETRACVPCALAAGTIEEAR